MIKNIGIVGGGQLGRMLAFEAKKMGFFVTVIDPTENSPAGQVADSQILAGYKDESAIRRLSKTSDVITFEIELANDSVLEDLIKGGQQVHPSPQTLKIIRDKFIQKQFLKKNKIPTADFVEVQSEEDILRAIKKFKYPVLLKARTDAYDGRGNALIRKKQDVKKAIRKLQGRSLYIEKFVPFAKELAIQVARSTNGQLKAYPLAETTHINNICHLVSVPASVSPAIQKKAETLSKKVMKILNGAGVFGIEMFLDRHGKVYINEIAPRVHNSGHYTIEASVTSQFEQHIRAITGLPLGETDMKTKAAVMVNILGRKNGEVDTQGIEKSLSIPNVSVHLYGKKENRIDRKMGHITVVGRSLNEITKKALLARRHIKI